MSVWRKVAWGVGVAALAAVATGAWLIASFDPNRYKGLLIDRVAKDYQRTLTLNGPISLSMWPRLQVELQSLSLSEHRQAARFAAIDEARLAVQVMPLLRGQFKVDRVDVRGVSLRYVRDVQGRSNIDDLLDPKDAAEEKAGEGEPLSFEVAGVALSGLRADVQDDKTGVHGRLMIEHFSSGRLADGVPSPVDFEARLDMTQPQKAAVRVHGKLVLTPQLSQGNTRLDDVSLTLSGEGPGWSQAEMEVEARSLQRDAARGVLSARALDLRARGIVGDPAAGALTRLDKARLTLAGLDIDPAAQRLNLEALALQVEGRQGASGMAAELGWPRLSIKGKQLEGSPLEGRLVRTGPVALEARFKSQAPTGSFQQVRLPGTAVDFTVSMAGQGGRREVKGQARADLQATPQARQVELTNLAASASVQEPGLRPLAVQLTGHAQAQAQAQAQVPAQARWTLQGRLNDNAFDTHGELAMAGDRPHVQATARFTALDLNRLLPAPAASSPAGAAGKSPADEAKAGGPAADPAVDLSPLAGVDGRLAFSAGQLEWRHYRVANARLAATLSKGTLDVQALSGQAWGGRFQAQGSAQAGPSTLALRAVAEGVDVHALLKDVADKDVLEGRGRVTLDVSAQGRRVSALMSSLDGSAFLSLRDGAVKGINLAKSLREAKARLSGRQDAVQEARQTEKTDFTEMTASFQIADGIATNRDLSAKSPFLRVGGQGRIDLARRRLDYTVSATVTGTVKGQGGAELEALKGLTVPVVLSGPWDEPAWRINWSAVALGAAQNTLKSRLEEELKGKLLGKKPVPADAAASAASAPARKPEDELKQKLKEGLKGLLSK